MSKRRFFAEILTISFDFYFQEEESKQNIESIYLQMDKSQNYREDKAEKSNRTELVFIFPNREKRTISFISSRYMSIYNTKQK